MAFTRAELAAMAEADAEIEAEFRLEPEDLALPRELDRTARFDGLPYEARKVAAQRKAYYEANREKYNACHRSCMQKRRAACKDGGCRCGRPEEPRKEATA